ncbi:MAG: FAD-dependent thymidylate synthase [Candidatus Saccharimonas sp.]
MSYEAKIIADSISETDDRLTTMEVTFPRMVLSEFNTHRAFSRNSASSRAIPLTKRIEQVREDPFVPEYWGENQSGMQAEQALGAKAANAAREEWMLALENALTTAEELDRLKVHKQLGNRVLEPFMWHTVIVTATEWSNFFALRANAMAQPEIRTIAEMMLDQYKHSDPVFVADGEWHLPLIQPDELELVRAEPELMRRVSAARCARVSYMTHDRKRDLSADETLYNRLVSGGHMSPLEHVATPTGNSDFVGNFRGWKQLRKFVPNEDDFSKVEKS